MKNVRNRKILSIILGALCIILIGGLGYFALTLRANVDELTLELATVTAQKEQEYASLTLALAEASTTIAALTSTLSLTAEELDELEDDYRKERNKNEEFEDQIKEIAGTVGDLDKLSKTDEELLQKYSKVYFLNEHYIPEKIEGITKSHLYNEELTKSVHAKVEPYLTDMIEDALADGVKLWVVSAYRSFAEQTYLKGSYTITYGSGANTFSADQGYSEHQLGTTIDFTTEGIGGGLVISFENTPAFAWLEDNGHKYGFTLSYPKGNAYYQYEPWHWRFVGEDLAEDLHDDGKYFYDLDQRTIDAYLIKIFD